MKPTPKILQQLVNDLGDRDRVVRVRARKQLICIGKPATAFLLKALQNPKDLMRWEAAKIFSELRDLCAVPLLVAALEDENIEVQWLSAEALISQGPEVIPPLLKALMDEPDSLLLRKGSHHVLRELARQRLLPKAASGVLPAIEGLDAQGSCSVAAERALEMIKKLYLASSLKQAKHRNT